MATLLPTLPEDRDKGVNDVYKKSFRFINKRKMRLDFSISKVEARAAIENIWDKVGDLNYKELIEGQIQQAIPDDYLRMLVYAVIKVQAEQYLASLPLMTVPHIGPSSNES